MYTITSAWTELLQQFFPVFTAPTAQNFLRLITGWILCTARRTVTGIIPFADPLALRAHDAYHRFFPDGKEKDDFFFTTDLTMTAAEVLECYNDRWAIEDTFKNTKQFLGGQEPQTFKSKGPERAAGLSLWMYSVVWLWYLSRKTNSRYFIVQPWNPLKAAPSFADAIACLRRELWKERIKCMFGKSAVHDKKFEFLLQALAPAA